MKLASIALACTAAACLEPGLVPCSDGRTCPRETACDLVHHSCVQPDQLAACDGLADFAACMANGVSNGKCFGGVCLTGGCGNGLLEPGELCDDGNNVSGDGCSADCLSREICGDGYVDPTRGEQCDDANTVGGDGCSGACQIEDLRWYAHNGTFTPRGGVALGWDGARQRLVMFGGSDGSADLGDTWEWDGTEWIDVSPLTSPSPSPRAFAAMAYDVHHHQLVLHGGVSTTGEPLSDTWTWDGAQWHRLATLIHPPGAAAAAMAWNGKAVIWFDPVTLQTWAFDGATWSTVATAHVPTSYSACSMAADPTTGKVVMFTYPAQTAMQGETWSFDGVDWTRVATIEPDPAYGAAIVWDTNSRVMLMEMAATATGNARTTWKLAGTTWTKVNTPNHPTEVTAVALAYDGGTGGEIAIGGYNIAGAPVGNQALTWSGTKWTTLTWGLPLVQQAMVDDPADGLVIANTGFATLGWNGTQWTGLGLSLNGAPYNASVAFDGARYVVTAFGGTSGSPAVLSNQTWVWHQSTWTLVSSSGPTPRTGGALSFDGNSGTVLLFGGTDAAGVQGDTWSWNGATWTQLSPATSPPPRSATAMAYDELRHRVVLFGGGDPSGAPLDDTWEWDGTTWAAVAFDPSLRPPARAGHAVLYDRRRRRIVIFGGVAADFSEWEYDGTQWEQPDSFGTPAAATPAFGAYDNARGELVVATSVGTITGSYLGPGEETCGAGVDLDGDGAVGCADSDCALACAPLCALGASCDPSLPHCGDGACQPYETARSCPSDCAVGSLSLQVCGDGYCAPLEVCPGDC